LVRYLFGAFPFFKFVPPRHQSSQNENIIAPFLKLQSDTVLVKTKRHYTSQAKHSSSTRATSKMISSTIRGAAAATKIAARSSSRLATISAPVGSLPHLNPAQVQIQSLQPSGDQHSATDLYQLLKEVSHLLMNPINAFFCFTVN
jgi:hypothetical protein